MPASAGESQNRSLLRVSPAAGQKAAGLYFSMLKIWHIDCLICICAKWQNMKNKIILGCTKGNKAMNLAYKTKNTEKREHVRHNCEAIIKWSYFNTATYFDAKLLNFSKSGVYFETGHSLKPGSTVFLKMTTVSSSEINSLDHAHPRSISLGEVKWRINLSGRDKSYYGVGVKYPVPA